MAQKITRQHLKCDTTVALSMIAICVESFSIDLISRILCVCCMGHIHCMSASHFCLLHCLPEWHFSHYKCATYRVPTDNLFRSAERIESWQSHCKMHKPN